jgi:hypothetical protein
MKRQLILLTTLIFFYIVLPVHGGMFLELGDLDGGHYDGLCSVDHVYVDCQHLANTANFFSNYVNPVSYENRIVGFVH